MNLLVIPPTLLMVMSQSDPSEHILESFQLNWSSQFYSLQLLLDVQYTEDHFWRLQSASLLTNVKLALLFGVSDCFLWPSDRAWLAHDVTHWNCCIMSKTELTVSRVITLFEKYLCICVPDSLFVCCLYKTQEVFRMNKSVAHLAFSF